MARADDRKKWVDKTLAERGIADTEANRKKLRSEYDKTNPKTPMLDESGDLTEGAIQKIRELFPAFAYLVEDDGGGFGADVRKIIVNAVLKEYETPRLVGELQGTAYFQTSSANQRQFDALKQGDKDAQVSRYSETIVSEYGRGSLTDEQVKNVASIAARNGLSGIQLRNYVFSQYLTMNQTSGVGAVTQMGGTERALVEQIAKKYYVSPSENEINDVLTGRVGIDDLEGRYRLQAKTLYPHLSQLIDAGSSLEDIASPYRRVAASILEMAETDIDMFDPTSKFRAALDGVDENGNPRRATLSEWTRMLRSDPTYGYQYTTQANNDATNIGLTIARAFGKVRR
jgi:hypothetical protein